MDTNKKSKEQEEKFKYLLDCPFFETMDSKREYEQRVIYFFSEETEDEIREAIIYIPIAEGFEYDWEFHRYQKLEDMAILKNSARSIQETEDWFKEIAKPVDNFTRLRKLMK